MPVFFFLTITAISAYVTYNDFKTKALQIAAQYARCIEIQLGSLSLPFSVISNNTFANAFDNGEDGVLVPQMQKTLKMAHYALITPILTKADSPLPQAEYSSLTGSSLLYKATHCYAPGKYVLGEFSVNLISLKSVYKNEKNAFMKNAELYMSLDGESFQYIGNKTRAVSAEELSADKRCFSCMTPVMNDKLYIYFLIPKSNILSTVAFLALLCLAVLVLFVAAALLVSRAYINHTVNGLDKLIENMDSYINEKGE